MTLGLIFTGILPVYLPNKIVAILAPAVLYMGCIGFLSPVAISKCIMSCPKNTGYASSLTGATTLLGSATASLSVNHLTHGSIHNLVYLSSIVLLIAFIAYIIAPKNA